MSRAKGCNPCPADARGTHSFEEVLGAGAAEDPPEKLDLSRYALVGRDQGVYGTCVGFGVQQALYSCAKQSAGFTAFEPPSPLAIYVQARAVAGMLKDPFDGTTISAAVYGLQRGGFFYERDFPYLPAVRNRAFKLGMGQNGLRRAGVRSHRILASSEQECWAMCKRLLASGKGVVGGWVVGDVFEDWRPSDGPWDGVAGPNPGGHCMGLMDYPNGQPRLNNSWGLKRGDRGFWEITPRALYKASSLWAIDAVPLA